MCKYYLERHNMFTLYKQDIFVLPFMGFLSFIFLFVSRENESSGCYEISQHAYKLLEVISYDIITTIPAIQQPTFNFHIISSLINLSKFLHNSRGNIKLKDEIL